MTEKGAWAYPGTAQMFEYPYFLRNGLSYGLRIWHFHSQGPFEQMMCKNFGEKGARAYPGSAQFLNTPYYLTNE